MNLKKDWNPLKVERTIGNLEELKLTKFKLLLEVYASTHNLMLYFNRFFFSISLSRYFLKFFMQVLRVLSIFIIIFVFFSRLMHLCENKSRINPNNLM